METVDNIQPEKYNFKNFTNFRSDGSKMDKRAMTIQRKIDGS